MQWRRCGVCVCVCVCGCGCGCGYGCKETNTHNTHPHSHIHTNHAPIHTHTYTHTLTHTPHISCRRATERSARYGMRSEARTFMNYTLPATHEAIQISLVSLALTSENTHLLYLSGRELRCSGRCGVLCPRQHVANEMSRCEALGGKCWAGGQRRGSVGWDGVG